MTWRRPDTRSKPSTRISTSFAPRSPRWAASPRRRSREAMQRLVAATARRAPRGRRGRQEDRRARGRGRARMAVQHHRPARADGRRPARGGRGAEDRRRGRADRRLCQEHRQARPGRSRAAARSSRSRCFREMARIAAEMVHDVLDAFVARDAAKARAGVRARRGGRRFLQQHLPHPAHLHDGEPAQHHPRRPTCCSSPRISSGSATMPPTSPRWSISPRPGASGRARAGRRIRPGRRTDRPPGGGALRPRCRARSRRTSPCGSGRARRRR